MSDKTFNTRIQLKHDVEANWLKAETFVPKRGELIVYEVDTNNNAPRVKIGDGTTVVSKLPFVSSAAEITTALESLDTSDPEANGNAIEFIDTISQTDGLIAATKKKVTVANGTTAGITIVYPAAQCTTYTSDNGTVTPAAVKKAVNLFAVPKDKDTGYTNTDIILIDSSQSTQENQPSITWKTVGENTPYIGFATDQSDGTFILTSLKGTNYASGLAIGGGSGNLLWQGKRVLTVDDNYVLPAATSSTLGGVKIGSNITVSSGTISLSKANVTAALGYTPPTTDTDTGATSVEVTGTGNAITAASYDASTRKLTLTKGATYSNNAGDITGVTAGVGIAGGATSGTATVKAKLRSETALTVDSSAATTTSGRVYPVAVDKSGYLAVNVPWADTDTGATSVTVTGSGNAITEASYDAATRKLTLTKGATYNNYTYTLPIADNSTLGGVKTTSTVTSTSGLTACPIISGVPYYKNTTYSIATTSANGLMSKADKAKLDNTNIAYGTCATDGATAAKVVTLVGNTNWALVNGAIIMVKFTNSNSAESVTLNVNSTGAYPIWYNASEYISTSTTYTGYAGRTTTYMFNGTHWVWVANSYDANTQSTTNSTNTSSKIFLVGATSQGSNKTTYSHDTVYVDTDGHVYSNGQKVLNVTNYGDYCLPLSGGTLTGNITVQKASGSTYVSVNNTSIGKINLQVSDSGNKGIYDNTNGKWIIYSDSNNITKVPGDQTITTAAVRNIKVITPGTVVTAGSTAITTGEIWLRYEE